MMTIEKPTKKTIEVLGKKMAYVEMGEGKPIVFQHGNPTSSYLWRNIMPYLASMGRCIAIDLIGMGDSEKLTNSGPGAYTFVEHSQYFEGALEALGVNKDVTLVIHDWGSALGFHWAHRNQAALKAICYMEAIVQPLTWNEWPEAATAAFQGFRSEAGDEMVLENNFFVEKMLPGSILRDMKPEEMAIYREPFLEKGEDRRPTLTWPRQIPLEGEPGNVVKLVAEYGSWLSKSTIPKLFINADPGAILIGSQREFCRTWPNQQEITVSGSHFIQEDSPDEIGKGIASWLTELA
ncbi:MAG: haloalkane dehalogenase [Flavobacterium sp.]|jgi:haloalkane dehalogenase